MQEEKEATKVVDVTAQFERTVVTGSIEFSVERKELFAALSQAQSEVGDPLKDSVNPHFRSKYADLAGVLDSVRKVFASKGLGIVQAPSSAGAQVSVTTLVTHKSGQWMSSTVSVRLAKDDTQVVGPQVVGSTITYLRRYSLSAMAGVAQTDDDGNAGAAGAEGAGADRGGSGGQDPKAAGKPSAPPGPRNSNAAAQSAKKPAAAKEASFAMSPQGKQALWDAFKAAYPDGKPDLLMTKIVEISAGQKTLNQITDEEAAFIGTQFLEMAAEVAGADDDDDPPWKDET